MIKAVLFDLDGTLLNRDASLQKFIALQYDRLINSLACIPKETYLSRFIELDERGYVWKDKVYQQLCNELSITTLKWENLLQDYLNHFKNSCIPFPHLFMMLDTLRSKSIQMGIITNGKGQFQMDNIEALGIDQYFQSIFISEWEGIKKPDRQIFCKALEQLRVLPEEAIFVGDHPENDVKAAQNAGMIGIWKKDVQWKNVKADYIIDDLSEVIFVINEINKREAQLH